MALVTAMLSSTVQAAESGSTGADGAFNPTIDTVLQLPADGIFNFTNVNIPAGVTVSFQKNDLNTPVTLLATGDVTIAGTLHVNGAWSPPVGAAGDGNIGDDGLPGEGGPGGYRGGYGGEPGQLPGAYGVGPGAGGGGVGKQSCGLGGDGGGFGENGKSAKYSEPDNHGGTYGSEFLLPLVGGSGGGGGGGSDTFHGSGGGGGGGALLIAASGTVNVAGAIRADGGSSGAAAGSGSGGTGGGGSGGAIRIFATRIEGNGAITARAGVMGDQAYNWNCRGADGGDGRIRLEAESFGRTSATQPAYTFGEPTTVFIAGLPGLRITRVAGIDAPAVPTGSADIILPADTPNPVTVEFETNGVPVGNTIKLTLTPTSGNATVVVSPALTGTTELATASVSVSLPEGASVMLAETSYTIIESQGEELSVFTDGERVESVRLAAGMDGSSRVTLVTVSGREFQLPSQVPFMPAG
jgi:hypothetical protein